VPTGQVIVWSAVVNRFLELLIVVTKAATSH
jgi:hypothetical protein